MKQVITLLSIWLLSIYCVFSQAVSKETAETVARNFMQEQGLQLQSKNQSQVNAMQIAPAQINKSISYSHNGKTPNYHVVKFDKGFVIVSGREEVKPIVGYSLEGEFDENDLPPAFEAMMQGFSRMTDSLAKAPTKAKLKTADNKWDLYKSNTADFSLKSQMTTQATTAGSAVEPLIKSKWHQFFPYNSFVQDQGKWKGCANTSNRNFAGKCAVGCVAMATSQIMHYWGYPLDTFDWCNIPNELPNIPVGGSVGPVVFSQILATTYLLSKVGKDLNMDYCRILNSKTGESDCLSQAGGVDGPNLLERYGYKDISAWWGFSFLFQYAKAELDLKRPMFVAGSTHAYVVDGYDNTGRLHYNFAWYGEADGYYEIYEDPWFDDLMRFYGGIEPPKITDCYSVFDIGECSYMPQWENCVHNPPVSGHIKVNNKTIKVGKKATYKAYQSITLGPNFTVEPGGMFECTIVPCPAPCSYPNK